MHDYLLHEMAKIKMDELRAEASRGRAARGGSAVARVEALPQHTGLVVGSRAGGFSRRTVEEACCA